MHWKCRVQYFCCVQNLSRPLYSTYRTKEYTSVRVPHPCDQRPFIDRPAALSSVSLSWLGRIWNLAEGGPLCTKPVNLHSIFCTGTGSSAEYTVLAGLLCAQQTTCIEISIFSQHFLSRSLFSLAVTIPVKRSLSLSLSLSTNLSFSLPLSPASLSHFYPSYLKMCWSEHELWTRGKPAIIFLHCCTCCGNNIYIYLQKVT